MLAICQLQIRRRIRTAQPPSSTVTNHNRFTMALRGAVVGHDPRDKIHIGLARGLHENRLAMNLPPAGASHRIVNAINGTL